MPVSRYSTTKIMAKYSKAYYENCPFESKLNIMSDEYRLKKGIEDKPRTIVYTDGKIEK